jgi:hypothetical protein
LQEDLGENVLKSIKDYLDIIKQDLSRDGVVAKKCLYESVTGASVRDSNMLCELAEKISARKGTILASAKDRLKMDNDLELVPFASRLRRKPPEGQKVISPEWQIMAWEFYESGVVSDVAKGHTNVMRVCISGHAFQKLV